MHIREALNLAWVGITSNKFRSFLTMLGMIIGVAAVIAVISIGDGASAMIVDSISSLGSGTITLSGGSGQTRLTLSDANYLLERSPSLTQMYPSVSGRGSVKAGTKTESYTLVGTTPAYSQVQQWQVASGSFITQNDVENRAMVAVLGDTVVQELFGDQAALGETVRIDGEIYEVVGVMSKKGSTMGMTTDNQVFIPVSTMQRVQGSKYIGQLTFLLKDDGNTKVAMGELQIGLSEIFGDVLERDNPFTITSMDDLMSVMDTTIGTLTLLLSGIAGISLVVGGIGIMNIMLVSVTERTREIGIRKALGGKYKDILGQFLIEAIIISLTGGLIGLGLGMLGSLLVANFAGWTFTVSASTITLALGFSIGVGLFFGVFPANKAAKMDPIEALRYQ